MPADKKASTCKCMHWLRLAGVHLNSAVSVLLYTLQNSAEVNHCKF